MFIDQGQGRYLRRMPIGMFRAKIDKVMHFLFNPIQTGFVENHPHPAGFSFLGIPMAFAQYKYNNENLN